jgi:hypothetical protein
MFGAVLVLIILPLLIIAMSFILYFAAGKKGKQRD